MVCHKLKCIFVAVPKTATTSIKRVLGSEELGIDLEALERGRKQNKAWCRLEAHPHKTLRDYKSKLRANIFNNYFKFGFVRNPWERTLSFFASTVRHNPARWGRIESFEEFVAFLTSSRSPLCRGSKLWRPATGKLRIKARRSQLDWLECSPKIDFIGKMENLQEDFDIICDKIGVTPPRLPHKNASRGPGQWNNGQQLLEPKHYSEYYNDQTRQAIAKLCKRDIERFGYKFEG